MTSEDGPDVPAAVIRVARVLHDLAERTAPGHGRTTEELARDAAAGRKRYSWAAFCAALGVPPFPAKEAPLVAYVRWRWLAGDSRFTIDGHLGGISAAHDHGADPGHWDAVKAAREALAAEARAAAEAGIPPRGRGQAPPMTVSRLRRIVAACPGDLAGARDRTLLLLGSASPPAARNWPRCPPAASRWSARACGSPPRTDGAAAGPSPCRRATIRSSTPSGRGWTGRPARAWNPAGPPSSGWTRRDAPPAGCPAGPSANGSRHAANGPGSRG
ncbi:hypothetical protein ACFY4C_36435 [Actinomadura viridis]|uniref:hypothetical protein n=1 Tax=Actinomadura viridis TaxID=58110 RepID=UPI0036889F45